MNEIKLCIEFHWGKRRPNLKYFLNNQELTVTSLEVVETHPNQENIVITLNSDFQKQNLFEIKMIDKTDDDLAMQDTGFIDHWVKIRQLELDQIKLDFLMYRACSFRHSMSDEWVANMAAQGHEIQPCYPSGTDIRLNGTWSINFDLPIWEWCVRTY